jgi:hypothetical protein
MFLGDKHPISVHIVMTVHGVFCFIVRIMWRGKRETEGERDREIEKSI